MRPPERAEPGGRREACRPAHSADSQPAQRSVAASVRSARRRGSGTDQRRDRRAPPARVDHRETGQRDLHHAQPLGGDPAAPPRSRTRGTCSKETQQRRGAHVPAGQRWGYFQVLGPASPDAGRAASSTPIGSQSEPPRRSDLRADRRRPTRAAGRHRSASRRVTRASGRGGPRRPGGWRKRHPEPERLAMSAPAGENYTRRLSGWRSLLRLAKITPNQQRSPATRRHSPAGASRSPAVRPDAW